MSSALCHCHRAAAASPAAPRRLSELLCYCSSVWGEGTGRGTHIRLLVRLQTPCHRAGYQSRRAVWEAGRQAGALTVPVYGSLSGLVYQQRGPARTDPTHRDLHRALSAPNSGQPAAGRAIGQQGREAETADGSYPECYFNVVCIGANG